MSKNYDFQTLRALIGDEADNNDNYYRDPEHVGELQAELKSGEKDKLSVTLATWIRQKKYGIDVRETMARFVEWISILTGKTMKISKDASDKVDKNRDDFIDLSNSVDDFKQEFNDKYDRQISSNTNLNEVIDARTDQKGENHLTLKKRIDAVETVANDGLGIAEFDDVDGGIRPIFRQPIKSMEDRLKQRTDNINIAQITDAHYTRKDHYWGPNNEAKRSLTHPLNIGALSGYLDFAISTGDNTDASNGDKYHPMKYNTDFATVFHTAIKCPTALLKGNHDDGSTWLHGKTGYNYDYCLTDAEFAKAYQQDGTQGETRDGNSNYFYMDIDGIRVIGLDSYDVVEETTEDGSVKYIRAENSAFSAKQVKWFVAKALNTDLPVIIFTHCPLVGTFDYSGQGISANHSAILTIIESFKRGQSGVVQSPGITPGAAIPDDYALNIQYNFSKPHDVIAVVYGHQHKDDKKVVNGINHVMSVNNFASNGPATAQNYKSYVDTEQEDSWTVFSINKASKKVDVLKFGRGTDTSFTY